MILYLIIGAAVGLLISITAQNIGGEIYTNRFYIWISVISAIGATLLIVLGIFQYHRLLKVAKNHTKYMDEDSYDKYRYNKYNEIQIYGVIGFVLSLISLAIPLVIMNTYFSLSIFLSTFVVYIGSIIFLTQTTKLINKLYPERNLPQPSDKNYTDKLLLASDEGERHIMTTALYKTFSFTQVGIFFGILLLIAYSMLTGESQIFSIIILGIIMIISNTKYYSEIKEK